MLLVRVTLREPREAPQGEAAQGSVAPQKSGRHVFSVSHHGESRPCEIMEFLAQQSPSEVEEIFSKAAELHGMHQAATREERITRFRQNRSNFHKMLSNTSGSSGWTTFTHSVSWDVKPQTSLPNAEALTTILARELQVSISLSLPWLEGGTSKTAWCASCCHVPGVSPVPAVSRHASFMEATSCLLRCLSTCEALCLHEEQPRVLSSCVPVFFVICFLGVIWVSPAV